MKRDLELIRKILLSMEAAQPCSSPEESPWQILWEKDKRFHEISYHIRMLIEQRYLYEDRVILEGVDHASNMVVKYSADSISNNGHEFLDSIRAPGVWEKTTHGILAAGGGYTLDLVKDLAKGFIRKQIEERTGVKL